MINNEINSVVYRVLIKVQVCVQDRVWTGWEVQNNSRRRLCLTDLLPAWTTSDLKHLKSTMSMGSKFWLCTNVFTKFQRVPRMASKFSLDTLILSSIFPLHKLVNILPFGTFATVVILSCNLHCRFRIIKHYNVKLTLMLMSMTRWFNLFRDHQMILITVNS